MVRGDVTHRSLYGARLPSHLPGARVGPYELYEKGMTIAPALTKLGVDADFGQLATQGPVEQAVRKLLLRAP